MPTDFTANNPGVAVFIDFDSVDLWVRYAFRNSPSAYVRGRECARLIRSSIDGVEGFWVPAPLPRLYVFVPNEIAERERKQWMVERARRMIRIC